MRAYFFIMQSLSPNQAELFFYRVDAGYLRYKTNFGTLLLKSPTKDLKYEAAEIYFDALEKASDLIPYEHILGLLYKYNVWNADLEAEFIQLQKDIDQLKINIYQNFFQKTDDYRLKLKAAEERVEELSNIRHSWDHYTDHGFAILYKTQFLIKNTTYLDDKIYNFKDLTVDDIFVYLNKNKLEDWQIRYLSRNEPWQTIYDMRNDYFVDETEDQRRLFLYTKMYRNILESPDCPDSAIVDDDDALDGWLLIKRKEREKIKKEDELERKLGRNKNAQELFIPADKDTWQKSTFDNIDELNQINDLNDETAKYNKRRRDIAIDKKGEVRFQDLPDIKQKAEMALNDKLTKG